MPSQPCATLPDSTSWAAICRTRSMGMAKPNAASLPPRSVVMPMTAPLASTSGPPDHDASMGSSVWIRPWSDSPSVSRRRSTALT